MRHACMMDSVMTLSDESYIMCVWSLLPIACLLLSSLFWRSDCWDLPPHPNVQLQTKGRESFKVTIINTRNGRDIFFLLSFHLSKLSRLQKQKLALTSVEYLRQSVPQLPTVFTSILCLFVPHLIITPFSIKKRINIKMRCLPYAILRENARKPNFQTSNKEKQRRRRSTTNRHILRGFFSGDLW